MIVLTNEIIIVKDWVTMLAIEFDSNPSSILGLNTMLRKASEARVDTRPRRYHLIVLLLPKIFTLACLLLSSI